VVIYEEKRNRPPIRFRRRPNLPLLDPSSRPGLVFQPHLADQYLVKSIPFASREAVYECGKGSGSRARYDSTEKK
jgi:hypothetical protein